MAILFVGLILAITHVYWLTNLTFNSEGFTCIRENHSFTTPTHAITHDLKFKFKSANRQWPRPYTTFSLHFHCVMGFWSYLTIIYQLTILPISDGKTNVSCLLTVARVIFHVMTKSLVAHAAIWAWGIKAVGVFWAHIGSLLAFVYICKLTTCPYGKTIQNFPYDAWMVSNTCHRESSEVKIWNLVDFSSTGLSHNWQI